MPSPYTWDLTKPAGGDAINIGDDQLRTDKTTLLSILRTLVPFGTPTVGWRQVQVNNVNYLAHNASYSGSSWNRDDTAEEASLIEHGNDGTIKLHFAAAAANPITWVEIFRWTTAGVISTGNVNRTRMKQPIVRTSLGANQSINDATVTAILMDSESIDTDSMHSTSSNTARHITPVAGKYAISGSISYASNATGQRQVRYQRYNSGGSAQEGHIAAQAQAVAAVLTVAGATIIMDCAANDYIQLEAYQNSGGALNVLGGGSQETKLSVWYVGE